MPRYASVDQTISMPWRGSGDAIEMVDQTVQPACLSNDGHWYCVEHSEGFPHNMAATSHYSKHEAACLFVWVCHEHGLEVPV